MENRWGLSGDSTELKRTKQCVRAERAAPNYNCNQRVTLSGLPTNQGVVGSNPAGRASKTIACDVAKSKPNSFPERPVRANNLSLMPRKRELFRGRACLSDAAQGAPPEHGGGD